MLLFVWSSSTHITASLSMCLLKFLRVNVPYVSAVALWNEFSILRFPEVFTSIELVTCELTLSASCYQVCPCWKLLQVCSLPNR